MFLYSLLSRLFPASFTAKVFFITFVGVHVPLLVLAVGEVARTAPLNDRLPLLLSMLLATIAGTLFCFGAIRAVLRPLYSVEQTMRAYEMTGRASPLPFGFFDEVGQLMERTNRLVLHVDRKLDETARAAETDPLTGLLNRRGFDRRVRDRASGGFLLIDIDRFKEVNDRDGHAAGDAVLVSVVRAIASTLRRSDALARFGGDEFVIFLPGATVHEARSAAERCRVAVMASVRAGDRMVTISVGAAQSHDPSAVAQMLARADAACYAAKAGGRNRVIGPEAAEVFAIAG